MSLTGTVFSGGSVGDFQVSWLRLTNSFPELLTVGLTTYSGDTRVRSSFVPPTNWRLSISNLTKEDSGIYWSERRCADGV